MKQILSKRFEVLDTVWNPKNDFQKARIKLTGFYIFILFIILNFFTGALFLILNQEQHQHQEKISIAWEKNEILFPNKKITVIKVQSKPKNIISKQEIFDLQQEFLEKIKYKIFLLELLLLFLAGILSYFLSGKTLNPIQKKNEQQRQFLADVSHELKNPLSALKTSIEVSKEQKDWKIGEIKEVFEDLESEISRLISTTEDLLELEKKDFKNIQKNISPQKILRKILKKLQIFADKKNIKIIFKSQGNLEIKCEEGEIEKIFFNLIHNAIKFSKPHSEIFINLNLKNSKIFSVQNFGEIIEKKDIKKIFNRFYKTENARTFSEENGSGLGLSIVKKICDKNSWNIFVESEKESGTIFKINF